MHRRGPNRRHFPQRRKGHAANNKSHPEEKVLVDHRAGAVGELHQEWQPAQVVVHQCNGRAVDGHFAARGAHGDADVAGGQSGRVVYAITNHSYLVALGLHGAHEVHFVLRQTFAFGFLATNLAAHSRRDRLAIARNHGDAADATVLQFHEGFAGFGAGLVLQANPADALTIPCDKNEAPAFGFIQINGFGKIFLHAIVLQPLSAANQHSARANISLNAASGRFGEILRLS